MPPAEIESAPSPPEGDALSAELWGRIPTYFSRQPLGTQARETVGNVKIEGMTFSERASWPPVNRFLPSLRLRGTGTGVKGFKHHLKVPHSQTVGIHVHLLSLPPSTLANRLKIW